MILCDNCGEPEGKRHFLEYGCLQFRPVEVVSNESCPLCEGIGTVPYGSMQVPCPECEEKGK